MSDLTTGAVVVAAIGAVFGAAVTPVGKKLRRFLFGRNDIRANIELDPWPPLPVLTTPSDLQPGHPGRAITTEVDPAEFERGHPNWESYGFVIPRDVADIPAPPSDLCREWRGWARSLGGVDAAKTKLQLTVEGLADGTVLIDGLEIDILRAGEALPGTHIWCPVGGASASPRQLYVDLDRHPPSVQFVERGDAPGETETRHFSFSLSRGEIETFLITAVAQQGSYDWVARLSYVVEGKRLAMDITDHGDPFRTSGTARAASYAWWDRGWTSREI